MFYLMKTKTRRVKPPTRLFRCIMLLMAFCMSSCSLFKVYAGKVEYADSQHQLHLSADSVYMESQKRMRLFNPLIFNTYETPTYRPSKG